MISWMPGVACYLISRGNKSVGYFILNGSNELVEFYLDNDTLARKEMVFSEIIKKFDIKSAYCKSFDQILLSCCYRLSGSSSLTGYLFQDSSIQSGIVSDNAIEVRLATIDDVPFLNSFDNEMLEEREEIDLYVMNNSVYMFLKEDELVGCGYLFNIIPGRVHWDVGMWVNQPFRRKGYGTQIISYLMKYCFDNGFVPTAGCAENNIASRLTLEKCGFISKLCLIHFQFR
jgi:GNAT superfamily N-acetyltransferase